MKKSGVSTGATIGALIVGLLIGAGAIYAAAPSMGLGGTTTSTSTVTGPTTTSTATTTKTVGAGATATITETQTMTNTVTVTGAGTTVTASGAGSLCSSGQTVTIGELTDLSGALSTEGIPVKDATQIAVSDINSWLASGGCTLKFQLAIDDYALDNTKALNQMQAFQAQGVAVVVGPLNSGTAQAILQYANSNHIVMISPSSTSPALAIPNDYLFRTAPNDAAQGLAAARVILDRGYNAVIIVNRHDTYGDGLANATAARFKALGGHVVDTIPYDTNTQDFTPILTKINSDFQSAQSTYGASKVAIYDVAFQEAGTMLLQAQSSFPNLLTPTWFGSDGEATLSQFVNGTAISQVSAKVKLVSTLYSPLNNSRTVDFGKVFTQQYKTTCSFYCLAAYDDVWIGALSIITAGKNDGAAVQALLPTVSDNFYGVTGWNGLQASGDRVPGSYQVWKVVLSSGGNGQWVLAGNWGYDTDTVTWLSPP